MSRCSSSRLNAILISTAIAIATFGSRASAAPITHGSKAPQTSSVLDAATDVAVAITAPAAIIRGGRLDAWLTVSNIGTATARNVTCGVSTPRADPATGFTVAISSQRLIDAVEGNESMQFRIASLKPGKSRTVRMAATTVRGTTTPDFALSAYCAPEHVDQHQANNSSKVTVTFGDSVSAFG